MERIGHRGAPREFRENTLPAFKRAFERRADAVELDAHATRDGVVVVNHDSIVGPGFGDLVGVPIADVDWTDLANASTSSATRIPTLDEVLSVVPPGATAYVEIKGAGIERQAADALLARGSKPWHPVHSFDHGTIRRMREIAPEIARGILFDDAILDVAAAMQAVGARDVWPRWSLIDRDLVDRVHAEGGRVIGDDR